MPFRWISAGLLIRLLHWNISAAFETPIANETLMTLPL
jgi:hypothetical protein